MKAKKVCIALLGALIVSGFMSVSRTKAQELATARFSQFCADFGYTPSVFAGPYRIKIAGAVYVYEWHPKGGNGLGQGLAGAYGFRVSVMPDGDTQTTLLDKPPR
jgi:hypothetical protein